jgi:tetraacyldisaccharide 4'-kinase
VEGDFIKINKWLLPFSCIYGLAVRLRNAMFEIGLLKSRSFNVPVISVGNITVGGTGKTPHVEYLVNMLQDLFRVAVLSRGYKRKSRGFVLADNDTDVSEIGDEPFQMKKKFPKVSIAVDKNRCHGIDQLLERDKALDVILLDDAFQHRYVKPGINILLVDYHRLIIYDTLLPAGRLREPLRGKDRADIVIVTKCPKELKPMEYRVIVKAMGLYPYQKLFFTTLDYGEPYPMFAEDNEVRDVRIASLADKHVLLLTGIGSPQQMIHDVQPLAAEVTPLTFSDHHHFKAKDIQLINETYAAIEGDKCIITTEKDATRLQGVDGLSDDVRRHLLVLPIQIRFMQEQDEMFNQQIIGYVRKNSRNSILAKGKDDHKPDNSNSPGDRPRTISFRNN